MASDKIQSYLDGPASRPPQGTVANLDNPPKHNTGPVVLLFFCLVLTSMACVGRAYSRIFVVKRLRPEDYLYDADPGTLPRPLLIFQLSYIVVAYGYIRYWINVGFFVHMWDLPGSTLVEISYDGFLVIMGYCFMLLFSKTAILLEWVHIFVPMGARNTFYWSARIMMVANILLYSSGVITTLAGCQPIERIWNFWIPGHCINKKARDIVNAAFNLVTDILILLLPQPVIWKLQMTSSRKNGVFVVFSVGCLVIVTSVGRLVGVIELDYPRVLTEVFDTSYQFSTELEWAIAELTCVMLVFCVPALPRIISEHTVLLTSRVTDVWRSWTRLGRGSDSGHSSKDWHSGQVWPQAPNNFPNSQERITDPHLSHNKHTDTSTIELAGMRDNYIRSKGETARDGVANSTELGILKSVDFDRHDATAINPHADHVAQQQHPWTRP